MNLLELLRDLERRSGRELSLCLSLNNEHSYLTWRMRTIDDHLPAGASGGMTFRRIESDNGSMHELSYDMQRGAELIGRLRIP